MVDNFIDSVLKVVNLQFNQNNLPNYYIPYNINNCVVFFWECGGIILYKKIMQTFSEDDGYWFISKYNTELCFASCHILGFIRCLQTVYDYLGEYGKPYNYSDSDTICGYEL